MVPFVTHLNMRHSAENETKAVNKKMKLQAVISCFCFIFVAHPLDIPSYVMFSPREIDFMPGKCNKYRQGLPLHAMTCFKPVKKIKLLFAHLGYLEGSEFLCDS